MGPFVATLAIPIVLFNFAGGIVGGIWLAVIGEWGALGTGIAALVFGTLAIGIALAPSLALLPLAESASRRSNIVAMVFLGIISVGYTYIVMAVWCVGAFVFFLEYAARGSVLPYLLWSYAVATGPWTYMARKEAQSDPGSWAPMSSFSAQIACITMIVIGLSIPGYRLEWTTLAIGFGAVMSVALIMQIMGLLSAQSQGRPY